MCGGSVTQWGRVTGSLLSLPHDERDVGLFLLSAQGVCPLMAAPNTMIYRVSLLKSIVYISVCVCEVVRSGRAPPDEMSHFTSSPSCMCGAQSAHLH